MARRSAPQRETAPYWFRPHRYGFGAVPKTWQGWALIAGYIVLLTGAAFALGADVLAAGGQPLAFVAVTIFLTAALIFICWRKTEGGMRWRWGEN